MKQKGLPLYYQVESDIKRRIDSGEWSKGAKLPSEPELAKEYDVSRATIRQAIANLVSAGFLTRRQGLGTFVSSPVFKGDYLKFFFPDELGGRHSILHCNLRKGKRSINEPLGLNMDEKVMELERLRYFNDDEDPAVLEKSYFRTELFALIKDADLSQKLYGLIEDSLKITLVRSENMIEPVLPTAQEAEYLKIDPSSPVLLISRVSYSDSGVPIVLTKSLIRANKCKLLVIS